MITKKFWFALIAIAALDAQAVVACAQTAESPLERAKGCPLEVIRAGPAETPEPLAAVCPSEQRLFGAWQVTLVPGPGGAAPSALALMTFNSDGTVLVANPGFAQVPCLAGGQGDCWIPGAASAGMGAWIRTGDAEYSMTYVHLLYDASGNFSGTAKVRSEVTVTQPEADLNGHFISEVFGHNGDPLLSVSGRIEGRRILVEEVSRTLPPRGVILRRR